jgi:PAS domain S-box-containing protein
MKQSKSNESLLQELGQLRHQYAELKAAYNKNIVAQEQAKEELLKSNSNLEEYFENDISADYVACVSGEIFSCNKTFLSLFGFEKKSDIEKFDITGLYKNPEDRKQVIRLVKKQGKIENHEVEFISKQRKTIHALMNAIGIFGKDGKLEKIRGYVVDITEQKKIEKELVKFKLCIERSFEAIFITDVEGCIAFINPAFEELYGFSSDECIGKTPRILKSGTLNEEIYKEFWSSLLSKNAVSGEIVNKTKDGSLLTIDGYNTSILDSKGNISCFIGIHRDITERKKAEQEIIHQSEMQNILRKIATDFINIRITEVDETINESLKVIGEFVKADRVYLFDYDWGKNICNNTYEWCSQGIQPQIEELQGISLEAIPHWVDTHKQGGIVHIPDVFALSEKDAVRQILEPQDIKSLISIPVMDGSLCIGFLGFDSVREHHNYTKSEEGVLVILAQMMANISRQKKIEKEQQKLTHAIEQSPVSIIITDINGNIEYINPKTLALTGYSKDELIGINPRIFSSGEKAKGEYEKLWSTISTGREWTGEFHNKKKNGELYWESASISPIKNENNEIINYVAVKEDITELKKLNDARDLLFEISQLHTKHLTINSFLGEVHQKLKQIIRADNFYVALYNEPDNTFSCSYHVDKFDKVELNKAYDFSKGYTDYVLKSNQSLIITPKDKLEVEKDGTIKGYGDELSVWLGVPFKTKKGDKPNGVIAIQDYQNLKSYSQTDKTIMEIIAQNICSFIERINFVEELIHAKEKAEESDRLKSAFLANMSHEIRNPMNGILGFTDLLLTPDLSSEEKESYIKIVHQSGQRMLNTVTDIVEISKIESGLINVSVKETDFNNRVEELYHFFQPEAEKKGLKLILEKLLPVEEKMISTDKNKLDSILTNLIKNAIKYTLSGTINMGCQSKGNFVEFYIKDTGIGIPVDRQEAVFERFMQADVGDTRVFEGSGLGLAIAKSYVEMLGGKIWVESEEGKGSIFYFNLPVKKNIEEKSSELIEASSDNKKKKLKILIAEDDETSRNYISILVNDFGAEILVAQTGIEAIELCLNTKDLNLILMDIKMPDLNGYEATRQIREFNKEVIIIAQTAFGISGDREKAIESGCNDYISKPINKKELQTLIQKYFEE